MKHGNENSQYIIQLPISKDLPYQQLYRGYHVDNEQINMIHIFPKSEVTEGMYQSILDRTEYYNYIQDIIEDQNHLLVVYANSTLWISLEQPMQFEQLKSMTAKLYEQYKLIDQGFIDFELDNIYTRDGQFFIIDYGLKVQFCKELIIKYHPDKAYTNLTKTWLFGRQLFTLLAGTNAGMNLIKFQQQSQLNKYITETTINLKISQEFIQILLKMLALEPLSRPKFEELDQFALFHKKKELKTLSNRTEFLLPQSSEALFSKIPKTTITGMHTTRPQSIDFGNKMDENHQQKVKNAFFASTRYKNQSHSRRIPQNKGQCSSYAYATMCINKNLSMKCKQSTITGFTNAQSIFQNTQNNFNNTQQPQYTNNQQITYTNQQQQYSFAKTESNSFKKQESFKQFVEPPKQKQEPIKISYLEPPKEAPRKIIEQPISSRTQVDDIPKTNYNQIQKIRSQEFSNPQQPMMVSPPLSFQANQDDSDLQAIQFDSGDRHHQVKKTDTIKQIPSIKVIKQDKVQFQDKESISNNNIPVMPTNNQRQSTEPIPVIEQKVKVHQPTNESVDVLAEQKIKMPSSSQVNKPKAQDSFQIQLSDEQIQDGCEKYTMYIDQINFIGDTVSNAIVILQASQSIWIIPLFMIFKRMYQIRMILKEEVDLQKNIFNIDNFNLFNQTAQFINIKNHLTIQNELIFKELQEMLVLVERRAGKLDQSGKDRLSVHMNTDIKKDLRDTAFVYLYQQIYTRVKNNLTKLQAGTLANNKFTEFEWLKMKIQLQITMCILETPQFQLNEDQYIPKEYNKIITNQDLGQGAKYSDKLEKELNVVKQRLIKQGYQL